MHLLVYVENLENVFLFLPLLHMYLNLFEKSSLARQLSANAFQLSFYSIQLKQCDPYTRVSD